MIFFGGLLCGTGLFFIGLPLAIYGVVVGVEGLVQGYDYDQEDFV
jgi:hypothetical protein